MLRAQEGNGPARLWYNLATVDDELVALRSCGLIAESSQHEIRGTGYVERNIRANRDGDSVETSWKKTRESK